MLRWEVITLQNMNLIEEVFHLYNHSFPIEVREPQSIFIKSLEYAENSFPNHFRFLVGLIGEKVVSFATGHYLADVNTGFIVYIATHTEVESKGIGRKALLKMEELLNQDALRAGKLSIKGFILETEMEDMVHTALEKQACKRRELFFERNGYQLITEFHYFQPPLHANETVVPLHLYLKPYQEFSLSREDIVQMIQAMFKEKYDRVNEIDSKTLRSCLEKMGIYV
jgi:hypothetical protein